MVGQGRNAGAGQGCRGVLDLGARQAVDDAGVSGVALADERLELGRGILLFNDFITNIRAVETRDEAWRTGKPEPGDDLLARHLVGSRGQCDARHIRKAFGDRGQADIFGTKIVSPLRHAMRFVDRKQRDIGLSKQGQAARCQKPLGRDVEQVEVAGEQPALDL